MDTEPDLLWCLLSIPWKIFCFFMLLPFRVLKHLFFAEDTGQPEDGMTRQVQVFDVDQARRAYYVGRRREQVDNYWWRCALENARRRRLLLQQGPVVEGNCETHEPKKSVQFDDTPEYIPPTPARDEQVANAVPSKPEGPIVDEKGSGGKGGQGDSHGGGISTEGNLEDVVNCFLQSAAVRGSMSRRRTW
ncbi:hypothetical protein CSHISOI_00901 [Colletotrichum shisoi]|uniref:Uncharacterized protein n=1 Tax=Colletotrichum shisoi TaxID=2078593 RepID=A0A5Q4C6C7_9PEZI|nr:hypothetical protein CSHISOI_00901 [Colletotrichum shisoi]